MSRLSFIDAPASSGAGPASGEPVIPAQSDAEALDAYSRAVSSVAERLARSVANLRISRRGRRGRLSVGGGSAVVITPDGFMLTSAHVVQGSSRTASASFVDGREVPASVVGSDLLSDLALLRADARDLEPATLGDAESLRVRAPGQRRVDEGRATHRS